MQQEQTNSCLININQTYSIMKKLILILVSFLVISQSFSYTWQSYGPDTIQAINVCFFEPPFEYSIICSTNGMYLMDGYQGEVLEYFSYPAKDAAQLNNDTILFVAGDGSYSDGIYSLNVQSYQVEVIHYCINPNFIKYYEPGGIFYVGYETGLLLSEDGLTWSEEPYFAGKNCIGMEYYSEHIIINVSADVTHLYLSDDSGASWFEGSNNPGWITNMAIKYYGKLYGIFPDNSYSSGLWSSTNYGDSWVNEFYSTNMTDVAYVMNYDKILVCWNSAGEKDEGIAIYESPGFTFINDGLPDTDINRIKVLDLFGGSIIYACTNNGVYSCGDYFVGINEHTTHSGSVDVFPNPVNSHTTIMVNLPEPINFDNSIKILNINGEIVDEIKFENNSFNEFEINWNKGNLPAGVYFLVIKTGKEILTEKFVIL